MVIFLSWSNSLASACCLVQGLGQNICDIVIGADASKPDDPLVVVESCHAVTEVHMLGPLAGDSQGATMLSLFIGEHGPIHAQPWLSA